jgi:hypothetical protein
MSKREEKPLKSRDIQGLKYVERLLPLLDQLHEVGCQRDKAGIGAMVKAASGSEE